MSSKQELITQSAGLPAPAELVKVDIKVNTSDMVDAMVFDSEEHLRSEKKRIDKDNTELLAERGKLLEKHLKLIDKFAKDYEDKKANALLKSISEFVGKQGMIEKSARQETNTKNRTYLKLDIAICAKEASRRYYSPETYCSKTIEVDLPKDLEQINKDLDKIAKTLEKNNAEMVKLDESIKELPHLKKRVKATMIKNKVRTVKDGEQLMKAIESAIIEASKQE